MERSPRPTRRRANRRRGQALVEFALVFPIFMLVLSGIMDFGFLLYQRMSVINASREAAHAAIVTENHANITTVAAGAAIASASQGGVSIDAGSIDVKCLNTSVNVASPTEIGCGSAVQGDSVLVTVSYSYKSFFPLFVGQTIPLSSATQMVLEI